MSEKDRASLESIGSKINELPAEAREDAMQYISGVVTGMAMALQAQGSAPVEE